MMAGHVMRTRIQVRRMKAESPSHSEEDEPCWQSTDSEEDSDDEAREHP